MRNATFGLTLAACLILCAPPAAAQELTQMEAQRAQRAAELLVEKAAEIKSPQVEIKADISKAFGLRFRKDGMLIVPQKGLKEEDENPDVKKEHGAPLGYLFLSSGFRPVVKGKPLPPDKLRTVKVVDNQGEEHTIACFLLAVRRVGEDSWHLYVYGPEKPPLVDAPFNLNEQGKPGLIALRVGDVEGTEGTLTITVFGKYEAGFRIAYQGY